MNRRFLVGLLSPFIVSVSICAQTTRPSEPADLLAGAKWTYSADGGKTFSPDPVTIKAETTAAVLARTEFAVAEPSEFVVLELTHGLPVRLQHKPKFTLNGSVVKGPVGGMYYKTIPAIDAKLLKKGRNVLTAGITIKNVSRGKRKAKDTQFKVAMRLAALKPKHLKIQTGPILGAFVEDHFTVTCRTNMPAKVSVVQEARPGRPHPSGINPPHLVTLTAATAGPSGLIHRARVTALKRRSKRAVFYLHARCGDFQRLASRPQTAFPHAGDKLRFVAMGDSRTFPKDWANVALAVVKAKPDLVVFSGDMVNRGRNDWEWDEQFFGPAKELLATIPFYAVIGNHEDNAPLYNELFYTPGKDGRARNWSQEINGVHLIGIDGGQDWSADSENARWLERTLAGSKAKFIFFFSHYPAWSSSMHGRLDEKTGRPREKAVRQGQDVLVPLLTKYKATAFICGHDHVYERSELPGGLTHVISGGAGAPLRKKAEAAAKQNPYSKVFVSTLHYCLFEVDGETCTMKALTPGGKTIDSCTWKK